MSAPQGSDAWKLDRCGRATASRFSDVLAKIKAGEAATRRTYRMQLVVERLTGEPQDHYHNAAMQWGTDHEAGAREAFDEATGLWTVQCGFVPHPDIMAGASPDGLIGSDATLEIKCPFNSAVHVETLTNGMPKEHMAQIQGALWITGRAFAWFVSFDPRMPPHLRLHHEKIARDEKYIEALQSGVVAFLGEVDAMHKKLMERTV